MSDDLGDFFIPAPAFKPDEALQRLRRDLREAGLTERAGAFERRGLPLVKAAVAGSTLVVSLAERPSRSPVWRDKVLKDSAQLRDQLTQIKQTLSTWSDRDE